MCAVANMHVVLVLYDPNIFQSIFVSLNVCVFVWMLIKQVILCLCCRRNQSGGDGGAQSWMQTSRLWQLHED